MRAQLPAKVAPVTKMYRVGPVLDQGDTPQCVGYSAKQFLQSDPIETMDGPTATDLYLAAQKEDEWEGENYEGTSVRGAAIALTNLGRLKSYVWGANALDVRDWIIVNGTVMMGTDWTETMFTPTASGYLRPTGEVVGGHAYLLVGYDAPGNKFLMVNSWGASWGNHGTAWIRFRDLDTLIQRQGEACAAVEQAIEPQMDLATLSREVQALKARVDILEQR
jgi:C1A family cysteine protease